MTGNLGILGGGWGGGEGGRTLGLGVGDLPTGTNPVKTRIPVFLWTDAVVRGTEMTAEDGVQAGPLKSNIKFIFNLASNTLVNQHADINRTIRILQDEKLVECIVVSDQFMTPSARFADVLLPADHSLERDDLGFPWSGEKYWVPVSFFGTALLLGGSASSAFINLHGPRNLLGFFLAGAVAGSLMLIVSTVWMLATLSRVPLDDFAAARLQEALYLVTSQHPVALGLHLLLTTVVPVAFAALLWFSRSSPGTSPWLRLLVFLAISMGAFIGRNLLYLVVTLPHQF